MSFAQHYRVCWYLVAEILFLRTPFTPPILEKVNFLSLYTIYLLKHCYFLNIEMLNF